jgi:integrase
MVYHAVHWCLSLGALRGAYRCPKEQSVANSKPKVLTATILDRQKITELTWVADATCKGLRARLSINKGSRQVAFYYRYRDRITGKRKTLKVGDYPAISIADARDKINTDLRPIADQELDVKVESKRQARSESDHAGNTIAGLMDEYLEFCELVGLAAGTIANYEQYLRPLRFWWGDRHPKDLTRADAMTIFFRVQKKGAVTKDGESTGRGGERAAGLVHSASRAYYTWLIDKEVVENNPWSRQKRMKVGESNVADTPTDEKMITKAMGMTGRDGLVFRLAIATGLRPTNVCGARWSEIKNGVWTINAENMKWKANKGAPDHVIYLSDYALNVLEQIRSTQKGRPRFLFPAEGAAGHLNVDTLRWDGISPKVPRAAARTLLQVLGCPFEERCRISHHAHQTKLGRSYDKHLYREETKKWWQVLGNKLATLEPDYEPTGNVVRIRKKA